MVRPILNPIRRQLEQQVRVKSTRFANDLEQSLEDTAPRQTGFLARSHRVATSFSDRRVRWTVTNTAPYAEAQAFGANPHVIRARRASVLAFYWPKAGGVVFFPRVNHPGNPANPWWTDGTGTRAGELLRRIWATS